MKFTALLLSLITLLASGASRADFTAASAQRGDFKEREEFNQTYELAQGALVEVSSIRGGVEIVTGNTLMAEVKIIRTARTRADLEYHKIEVKLSGKGLVVRGVQEPERRQRENVQVNHQVILTLPRRVDLSVHSISGPLKVGDVDGQVQASSISGSANIGNVSGKVDVKSISGSFEVGNVGGEARVSSVSGSLHLGQVNGSLEVSSVSGSLNATLDSLSPQGIHIKSISGSVEIRFENEVNADFNAVSVSGKVYLDVPNVFRDNEEDSSNVRARIGAGGTPISISSVSGNIRLKRS